MISGTGSFTIHMDLGGYKLWYWYDGIGSSGLCWSYRRLNHASLGPTSRSIVSTPTFDLIPA